MGFIVIEGLDGAGKSTQLALIEEYFAKKELKTRFIHFPRTDTRIWGELISKFLRGDLGNMEQVNPYLVALLYAGDRKDAAHELQAWMDEGYVVLADRYLYSNIAFQCAKVPEENERKKLAAWIKHFEYEYNRIPIPDLNLFLSVPFHFTEKSLGNRRQGNDRDYLNGGTDIHEADLSFQEKVRKMYFEQVKLNNDFELIECSGEQGEMLAPELISEKIIQKIEHNLSVI